MELREKGKISFTITGVSWPVYNEYYLVEDNGKQLIIGLTRPGGKAYNPLYREGVLNLALFRRFAETPENPKDILNFVKKYGLLWEEEKQWLREEGTVKEIVVESVEKIIEELKRFKKVTMLYELLLKLKEDPNNPEALNTLNGVVEYRKWPPDRLGPLRLVDPEEEKTPYYLPSSWKPGTRREYDIDKVEAIPLIHPVFPDDPVIISKPDEDRTTRTKEGISFYLVEYTSEKLKEGVFPSYHGLPHKKLKKGVFLSSYGIPPGDNEPLSFSIFPSLECRDLASAMWLQFFIVLKNGIRLKPCKNENCPGFVEEGRREYCDNGDRCKRAKNQREYRRRKAQEKERGKASGA